MHNLIEYERDWPTLQHVSAFHTEMDSAHVANCSEVLSHVIRRTEFLKKSSAECNTDHEEDDP